MLNSKGKEKERAQGPTAKSWQVTLPSQDPLHLIKSNPHHHVSKNSRFQVKRVATTFSECIASEKFREQLALEILTAFTEGTFIPRDQEGQLLLLAYIRQQASSENTSQPTGKEKEQETRREVIQDARQNLLFYCKNLSVCQYYLAAMRCGQITLGVMSIVLYAPFVNASIYFWQETPEEQLTLWHYSPSSSSKILHILGDSHSKQWTFLSAISPQEKLKLMPRQDYFGLKVGDPPGLFKNAETRDKKGKGKEKRAFSYAEVYCPPISLRSQTEGTYISIRSGNIHLLKLLLEQDPKRFVKGKPLLLSDVILVKKIVEQQYSTIAQLFSKPEKDDPVQMDIHTINECLVSNVARECQTYLHASYSNQERMESLRLRYTLQITEPCNDVSIALTALQKTVILLLDQCEYCLQYVSGDTKNFTPTWEKTLLINYLCAHPHELPPCYQNKCNLPAFFDELQCANISPNHRNKKTGHSLLSLAIGYQQATVVALLIERGADPLLRDHTKLRLCPFDHAIDFAIEGNTAMLTTLIAACEQHQWPVFLTLDPRHVAEDPVLVQWVEKMETFLQQLHHYLKEWAKCKSPEKSRRKSISQFFTPQPDDNRPTEVVLYYEYIRYYGSRFDLHSLNINVMRLASRAKRGMLKECSLHDTMTRVLTDLLKTTDNEALSHSAMRYQRKLESPGPENSEAIEPELLQLEFEPHQDVCSLESFQFSDWTLIARNN